MAVADMRYSLIEAMMKQCVKKRESETSVSDRIDMIVTNKYLGIPVFFLILFLMFIVTFGPIGEGLKGWVEMLINDVLAENLLAALASMAVAPWALDLVNTVIGGVGSVLSFTLRNRACKGHDHSMDITASEVTQDFLLDEYAREMIGEWNRWMTLKRFRAFESRITKANPQITKFDKNIHYLRPIPTAELLLIDNANEYQIRTFLLRFLHAFLPGNHILRLE